MIMNNISIHSVSKEKHFILAPRNRLCQIRRRLRCMELTVTSYTYSSSCGLYSIKANSSRRCDSYTTLHDFWVPKFTFFTVISRCHLQVSDMQNCSVQLQVCWCCWPEGVIQETQSECLNQVVQPVS